MKRLHGRSVIYLKFVENSCTNNSSQYSISAVKNQQSFTIRYNNNTYSEHMHRAHSGMKKFKIAHNHHDRRKIYKIFVIGYRSVLLFFFFFFILLRKKPSFPLEVAIFSTFSSLFVSRSFVFSLASSHFTDGYEMYVFSYSKQYCILLVIQMVNASVFPLVSMQSSVLLPSCCHE